MSLKLSHLITLTLLITFISFSSAVTDENICDTQCDYCCREKVCRSKDDCEGNFTPFVILGIVAGGIIGLLVLRKLYLYWKSKNPPKNPEQKKSRRTRTRAKSPKPTKEKKDKRGNKKREEKTQSKQEIYLQIDNESIVGVESSVKSEVTSKQVLDKERILDHKASSKAEVTSKSKLEADDKGKDTNRSDKKREASAPRSKTPSKTPATGKSGSSKAPTKKPANGSKPSGSTKMNASTNKMNASTASASKERGRSANKSDKERSGSQKKSQGPADKEKLNKKKNQD